MSSPTTLRVALAGAGMVSAHHLTAWSRTDSAEVVALADPDMEKAARRAADFGVSQVYDSAERMLDAERPDAVDIAAPMATHGDLVRLAADRGIDTLCQKPLAPTLEQAQAIAQSTEGRIRLMVHENWRFRPHYRQIAAWLGEGAIGDPAAFLMQSVSSSLLSPTEGGPPPGLTRQPFLAKMERLIVLELLVHHLDTLGFLLGPLRIVSAALSRNSAHVRGEDTAVIALAAGPANGVLFASMAAAGAPPRPGDNLQIIGSAGRIVLDGATLRLDGRKSATADLDLEQAYQASYDGAIAHFADCIIDGSPFEISPDVHLHALEAMERIYALGGLPASAP